MSDETKEYGHWSRPFLRALAISLNALGPAIGVPGLGIPIDLWLQDDIDEQLDRIEKERTELTENKIREEILLQILSSSQKITLKQAEFITRMLWIITSDSKFNDVIRQKGKVLTEEDFKPIIESSLPKEKPDEHEMRKLVRDGLAKSYTDMNSLKGHIIDIKFNTIDIPPNVSMPREGFNKFEENIWHQSLSIQKQVLSALIINNPLRAEFRKAAALHSILTNQQEEDGSSKGTPGNNPPGDKSPVWMRRRIEWLTKWRHDRKDFDHCKNPTNKQRNKVQCRTIVNSLALTSDLIRLNIAANETWTVWNFLIRIHDQLTIAFNANLRLRRYQNEHIGEWIAILHEFKDTIDDLLGARDYKDAHEITGWKRLNKFLSWRLKNDERAIQRLIGGLEILEKSNVDDQKEINDLLTPNFLLCIAGLCKSLENVRKERCEESQKHILKTMKMEAGGILADKIKDCYYNLPHNKLDREYSWIWQENQRP